ncbi:Transcription factor TFIIIB component B [Mortierella sp. GBA43]|nr:Transcription factor TFIIIB component B [Mortierella sp. GBA43]
MSAISARIDKGQTRFAPKLKARPTRGKATASEDGTPAPTPSIGSTDSGIQAASAESEAVDTGINANNNTSDTGASAVPTEPKDHQSRRLSTSTQLSSTATTSIAATAIGPSSSLASSASQSRAAPKSPTFTSTKVQKSSQATAISTPSQTAPPEVSASSSPSTVPSSSSSSSSLNTTSQKPIKGASIISIPSARTHTEMEAAEESETGESSTTTTGTTSMSRKRAKHGKQIRPSGRASHASQNGVVPTGEDGQENGEGEDDEEEAWPDYANMFMYEFVKDLGVGRRSKMFAEHQKLLNQKRKENKKEERIRAIRLYEGRGPVDQSTSSSASTSSLQGSSAAEIRGKRAESMGVGAEAEGIMQDDQDDDDDATQPKDEGFRAENGTSASSASAPGLKTIAPQALSQWGTDFGIICRLFPSKTRIAVRNKYKREDRLNHSRVEGALNNRKPINLEYYSQLTQTAFPEVSEEAMIQPEIEKEDEEQDPFEDNRGYEEDYEVAADEEEVVQEEEEEIVGMIE